MKHIEQNGMVQSGEEFVTEAKDLGDRRQDVALRIAQRAGNALVLLLEAYETSQELRRSPWDLAVEIGELRRSGLTNSDLRWLVFKGYVEHGRETTPDRFSGRSFQRGVGLNFDLCACFVLTPDGMFFAEAACAHAAMQHATRSGQERDKGSPANGAKPSNGSKPQAKQNGQLFPQWDRDLQELRVGQHLVKRFKVPAVNQETILSAFDEEGWPTRIDDPLPPHPEHDSKRRLHDTINSLNRNQKNGLIRFFGDGSGEGVRWDLVVPAVEERCYVSAE